MMNFGRKAWALAVRIWRSGVLGHGLFWSWNFIFLIVTGFGLLPHILWDLFRGLVNGEVPVSLALGGLLLLLIPLISTGVGLRFFLRQPGQLVRLFYGVEAPFMVFVLLRVFLLRELTLPVDFLLAMASISLCSYGYALAFPSFRQPGRTGPLRMLGHTLALLSCLYIGLILFVYAPPLLYALIREFLRFEWAHVLLRGLRHGHGSALILLPMGMLLVAYTATLLVALPVVLAALYAQSYLHAARSLLFRRRGAVLLGAITLGAAAACVAVFTITSRQPQAAAFALIGGDGGIPPQDDAERLRRLKAAEKIRAGLLNAYLANYRYLSATGSNDHIIDIYEKTFGLSRERGRALQDAHNALLRPVLYQGESVRADQVKAELAYAAFFDEPIEKAERAAIRAAISATYERDRREAGLLAVDERKVLLLKQEVVLGEMGDAAQVELHEVYENQTIEQQEIFYYFTLPESAAVTGLWLGESEDRGARYRFTVAPRGAAQKVYKAEVRRRMDPALLEQVGPRQYRLRAFPIPPRPRMQEGDRLPKKAPPFHLWMTYRTAARCADRGACTWPLPRLRERRNVYVTSSTERLYPPGTGAVLPQPDGAPGWLPEGLPARSSVMPRPHALRLPNGTVLWARPEARAAQAFGPPAGQALAVVLDRSRSMARHAAEVSASFAWLRQHVAPRHRIDLYLSAAAARGEPPRRVEGLDGFDAGAVIYYGGQPAAALLQQFAALRGDRAYAAVLVLTDDGSLDLSSGADPVRDFGAKVVLVHLGGRLPPGYDDATLATLQKRGGAAVSSLEEALRYLGAAAAPAFVGWDEGYLFTLQAAAPATDMDRDPGQGQGGADDPFAPILARQLIKGLMSGLDLADAAHLDHLHALARRYEVVTPYSSMLVLLEERQREALRRAEKEADRFQRDTEAGTTLDGRTTSVVATPEPAEWALLGLAGLGLLFIRRRQVRWAWRAL